MQSKFKIDKNVAIILRVHGETPYLDEALESIAQQTVISQIVVIIVRDRPSLSTYKVIENYRKRIDIIEVDANPIGATNALNTGLLNSIYEYTAILDADDVMTPYRIETQQRFLENNPGVGVVGSYIDIIDEDGQIIARKKYETDSIAIQSQKLTKVPVANPAVLFRTRLIKGIGGYRSFYPYADDRDLWIRVQEVSMISNIPQYLTKYREHSKQLTKVHRNRLILHSLAVIESAQNREKGLPEISENYVSVEAWGEKVSIRIKVSWLIFERQSLESIVKNWKNKNFILFSLMAIIYFMINPKSFLSYLSKLRKKQEDILNTDYKN